MNPKRSIIIAVSLVIAGLGVHRGLFAEMMLELSEFNHLNPWIGGFITGAVALIIFFVSHSVIDAFVRNVEQGVARIKRVIKQAWLREKKNIRFNSQDYPDR